MNHISIIGKISEKPKLTIVKTPLSEKAMVVFKVLDPGLPYQTTTPDEYEVHFMKDAANHIFKYMTLEKEIVVFGYMKRDKQKRDVYINAEYIQFTGKPVKEVLNV